ncbi:hypothetical protein HUT18_10625 [Streptomyces sp. NA04227]|uniref:NAD(P)-dependent oxidoreductase n=1 Tax=Streptomyces sp. NA04227 TaxID=2742136 RepID=UPI00159065AD|nr:NAD(P)-dependent oxidoreductase [Streptomyces sp. NA04227]QKW06780.1 hypothetical protein HUT18_10625 [Streptomyces sp. NA04227]
MKGTVFVALADLAHNRRAFGELSATFENVHVVSAREHALAELAALGDEVTAAVIGVRERIDASVLDAVPRLGVVASVGAGTDHLDLAALSDRGIRLVTTPGVNAVSVAEHAMMMILAVSKRALSGHAAVLSGADRAGLLAPPLEIRGRRVGVLGAGATARALLPMLRAFGTDTVFWTRRPEAHPDLPLMDLKALFRRSDIISVHLPLTDRTRGLLGPELLSLLPPGALVVNTARKEILDFSALPAVVAERPDLRFAVDDFGLAADGVPSMLGDAALWSPHVAGVTVEALRAMEDMAVDGLVDAVVDSVARDVQELSE